MSGGNTKNGGLIFIEKDNSDAGLISVMAIGMDEVSPVKLLLLKAKGPEKFIGQVYAIVVG